MPDVDQARDIIKRALRFSSKADGAEVQLGGGRFSLTRFANNAIHQNVEERNLEVSVRVILGKRTARATTNRIDDEGLERVVARATAAAELAAEDGELLPVFKGGAELISRSVDAATDAASAQDRARAVVDIIAAAKKAGLTAAGQLTTARGSIGNYGDMGTFAMGNSAGRFCFHDATTAEFSLTILGENSSGWAEAFSHRLSDMDLSSLTRRAIDKARLSADPIAVEPGEHTVILEPAAAASLVSFLSGGLNGRGYHNGSSWAAGSLGEAVTGPRFSLSAEPRNPANPRRPFDGEGVENQRLSLISDGRLRALSYDRKSAAKHGAEPTGYGPRQPTGWAGAPGALVVAGGDDSLESMIRSTRRGILVTRFWYNRQVEPKRVVVTGMTRDGTFLIKDGKVSEGLKNLRYNQSVLDAFQSIEALSKPERAGGMLVPAMKLGRFRFTSSTRF